MAVTHNSCRIEGCPGLRIAAVDSGTVSAEPRSFPGVPRQGAETPMAGGGAGTLNLIRIMPAEGREASIDPQPNPSRRSRRAR